MRRTGYSRIESIHLVNSAPTNLRPGETVVRIFLILACLALATMLSGVLHARLGWFRIALFLVGGLLVIGSTWLHLEAATASQIERIRLRRARRGMLVRTGPVGLPNTVGGVVAGAWLCMKADYREKRIQYRREVGDQRANLDARYQLVVATVRINGNEQVLSFSDGSVVIWNPRSSVYELHWEGLESCARDDEVREAWDAAHALESLVGRLYRSLPSGMDPRDVAGHLLGQYSYKSVLRCLQTAEWWGLI
jgi:hypothetical protein